MRVLIAGSSGLIGSRLVQYLGEQGHTVIRLVRRSPGKGEGEVLWNPDEGMIDAKAIEGFDGVVNVASISWAGRWTPAFKNKIHANRTRTNSLLSETLAHCRSKPQVLICASGQGIYPSSEDRVLPEDAPVGNDFLARLQCDGEAATASASTAGIRVVNLRIPTVLGGPNLAQMVSNVRRLGSGYQWWSWVGRDELASIIDYVLLTENLTGPINPVSPISVTNSEFVATLARVLGVKPKTPIPAFLLRLAMGEAADALVLASRRLEPLKLLSSGYRFRFSELQDALRHELCVPDQGESR